MKVEHEYGVDPAACSSSAGRWSSDEVGAGARSGADAPVIGCGSKVTATTGQPAEPLRPAVVSGREHVLVAAVHPVEVADRDDGPGPRSPATSSRPCQIRTAPACHLPLLPHPVHGATNPPAAPPDGCRTGAGYRAQSAAVAARGRGGVRRRARPPRRLGSRPA